MLGAHVVVVLLLVGAKVSGENVVEDQGNRNLSLTESRPSGGAVSDEDSQETYDLGNVFDDRIYPCRNGGTFGVIREAYKCICPHQYVGKHCEIRVDICSQATYPDGRLPCAAEAKSCNALIGGGFSCLSQGRARDSHKVTAECAEPSPCPAHWGCVSLESGGFRCEPRAVGRIPRSPAACGKLVNLCEKGAACEAGRCVCLKHYQGQYCNEEVDYCLSSPCPAGVYCEPILGGFICDCPDTRRGIKCEIKKKPTEQALKSLNFLYYPQQYSGWEFPYCLYATSIRSDIVIKIDFGNGVVVKDYASNFEHFDNFRVHLLKTFLPPLMVLHSEVVAYTINHTYAKPGYYNVQVEVMDDRHYLFNSSYTVNVGAPNVCSFGLRLENCAQSKADAFDFLPKDTIDIESVIHVDCIEAEFTFLWALYKVQESEVLNESTHFKLEGDIETTGHNLHIPKFTLPSGMYIVRLMVNMTVPNIRHATVDTWFIVNKINPRPKIEGNSVSVYHWDEPIVLNASITHDTRYETERKLLQSYKFTWYCETENTSIPGYCPQKPLNETGPILTIPPKTLSVLNHEFRFYVYLFMPTNVNMVTVYTAPNSSDIFRIECVENCGDTIDPNEVTAFRATCIGDTCEAHKDTHIYEWRVIMQQKTHWSLQDSQTEFGLKDEMLIIRRNVLKHSTRYMFDLIAYFNDGSGQRHQYGGARVTRATMGIKSLISSNCSISPLTGFSVITNFTITCNVDIKNALLTYEVAQLKSIANLTLGQVWVSYDTESRITNIRLSSGSADSDHLTSLRVIIRKKNDAEAFHVLNVTVYPATFYTKVPQRLFQEIYHQLFGRKSELAILHTAKDSYGLIQVIRCAAAEVLELISVDYGRYFSGKSHFLREIFVLRESMLEYLSQQNVYRVEELKHFAITTIMVLQLPSKRILPSTFQVVNTIYDNILLTVKTFIKNDIRLTKIDQRELGESLVSIGSMIMKRAILLTSGRTHQVHYDPDDGEHNIWAIKKLIGGDIQKSPLKLLTRQIINSISSYFMMNIKYLSLNGPVVAIQRGEFSFMIRRASFIRVDNISLELLHGSVTPLIGANYSGKSFIVNTLELNYNPYWWHARLKHNTFPYISFNVFQDEPQTKINVTARIEMNALENAPVPETIRVELNVVPFWKFSEDQMTVYRLTVPEGGKLALYFVPHKEKIQFVLKKDVRPDVHDFWDNAITLPQADQMKKHTRKLIVVENMVVDKDQPVYLGIMPHVDTLRKLLAPNNKMYHFREPNMLSDEDIYPSREDQVPSLAQLQRTKSNGSEHQKVTLPFEFATLIAQCYNFKQLTLKLRSTCYVNESKLHTISCTCSEMSHPVVEITRTRMERSIFTDTPFSITSQDNPVILFVMLYIVSIFTVMFLWAWSADREDRTKRDVIFLRDNHPSHGYTYVLIVYTGRRPGSGTTSKVAIQLVGEEGSSSVHILTERSRCVLTRGSQEWFVLKTEQYLGDISWINLWHDQSGASPAWFCDKVVVHDIHTHGVWMFVTSQWLAPLHGDGSMSCSVEQTRDMDLFKKRFRFPEYFMDACDSGHHGWISMMHTRTGETFTRCQRVAVTLTYAAVITAIVAHMYAGLTTKDGRAAYEWSLNDHTTGLYAALLAVPVYFGLCWLFRCIEPLSPHDDSRLPSSTSITWKISATSNKPKSKNDIIDEQRKLPYVIRNERSPKAANAIVNTPMQGQRIVDQVFCLPSWSIYFAWIFLLIIVSTCTYLSTFHGITHSYVLSICFLISFITAILTSMVLETVKVALIALFYSLFANTRLMSIEDRSELVRNLNRAHEEKRRQFESQILDELSTLRKRAIYKPIPYKRVLLLRKNAISEATTRHVTRDLCIFILSFIILACFFDKIRHSKQYFHVLNLKNIVSNRNSHGKSSELQKIDNQEQYLNYINDTLIPNIYKEHEYNGDLSEKGQMVDLTNYLIGVPRLRQIRLSKESCINVFNSKQKWAGRCSGSNTGWVDGDTADYDKSWKTLKGDVNDTIWVHNNYVELETGPTIGEISIYPGSGYIALLKRTKGESQSTLTHLIEIEWLDHLTVALFLEFAVFNANLNLVSTVALLGERSATGAYHVTSSVQAMKLDSTGAISMTFTLAVFVILIVVMIVRVRGETIRISRLNETRYIGNSWYALRIALVLLGALAMAMFVVCEFITAASMQKLFDADMREFVNFYGLAYLIEILTAVLGVMFFLIILELWHIISFYFEFQIMLTTLHVASHSLFYYFIMFSLFILAFVWIAHLLFVTSSSKFKTVLSATIGLCGFAQEDIFDDSSISFLESTIGFGRGIFYLVFFVAYMFIFRWGFALILINKYKRVVSVAQNAWLDPILNRHVRAKCASRRFLRMQSMTRDYIQAIGVLLRDASRPLSNARFQAMVQIVGQFKSQDTIGPELLARAKNLAMTSLVVDNMIMNSGKTAFISRASPLVRTSLRMTALQNKIQKLNDVVTNLIDTNEI